MSVKCLTKQQKQYVFHAYKNNTMSQVQMAMNLGVSPRTIYRVLREVVINE